MGGGEGAVFSHNKKTVIEIFRPEQAGDKGRTIFVCLYAPATHKERRVGGGGG